MSKRLVIFDLDGTLVDTLTDVGMCFNEALSLHGFAPHPVDSYGNFVGGNLETVVSRLLPEGARVPEVVDRVKNDYRRIYMDSPKLNTKPYPGVVELLRALRDAGIYMAVNTNKGQDLADECVNALFEEFDLLVVGYREGKPSKPDPSGVQELMSMVGASASETLYVGDAGTDVATAQNAGVECVLVAWGQGSDDDYANPYVTRIVQTAGDILAAVR